MKHPTAQNIPGIGIPPALMRMREAADYLRVSSRYMATLRARKVVPCIKIGPKCVRFRRGDLDAFIQGKVA